MTSEERELQWMEKKKEWMDRFKERFRGNAANMDEWHEAANAVWSFIAEYGECPMIEKFVGKV